MALSDFIKKRGGALTDVDEDKGGKKRELEGAWKYIICYFRQRNIQAVRHLR